MPTSFLFSIILSNITVSHFYLITYCAAANIWTEHETAQGTVSLACVKCVETSRLLVFICIQYRMVHFFFKKKIASYLYKLYLWCEHTEICAWIFLLCFVFGATNEIGWIIFKGMLLIYLLIDPLAQRSQSSFRSLALSIFCFKISFSPFFPSSLCTRDSKCM